MRVGFLCNPVAGMGGRVGLKGTDGKLAAAVERGAEPRASERAARALAGLADAAPDATVLTWGAPMGEATVRAAGFDPVVVGRPDPSPGPGDPFGTGAADTRAAVRAFVDAGVDVVWFVGGDGTAADVATAVTGAGDGDDPTPMLGVPAGVKVYSSTFAVSPEAAAEVLATFDRVERREVVDVDEDDYRAGDAEPTLHAVVPVPVADGVQSRKRTGGGSVDALAAGVAADVRPGTTYVFGPGSTVGAVTDALGVDGTPLGVDVWRAGERDADGQATGDLLARDASEAEILAALPDGGRAVVIVSPIGGQGFVFGRGNPQLSPAVIRRCAVEVVASRAKLDDLTVLRADTGDPDLDATLRGWWRVRVGRVERRAMLLE